MAELNLNGVGLPSRNVGCVLAVVKAGSKLPTPDTLPILNPEHKPKGAAMDDGKRLGTILAGLTALGIAGTAQAIEARHKTEHDSGSVRAPHTGVAVPEGEMPSTGYSPTLQGVRASEPFLARTGSLS